MALDGIPRRNRSDRQYVAGGCWVGWRALVSALVLLLGAGGGRDVAAAEKVPAFPYEQYSDAQGHFKYDGAALKLVKRPAHLKQVYEAAAQEDARAKVLVSELEYWFRQAGLVVADTTTRPACLGLKEMTPACQPNWQFLKEFLGDTHEAERLRQVVANAYEARAKERGLQNQVIMAGINLLLAGGMAKGVMNQAAAVEARAAARQALAAEAKAAQADARAAGQSGVAVKVGSEVAGQGFRSFSAFKRTMGPAGPGKQWHHIVEQTPGNVGRFGPEAIHNTSNLVPLETSVHRQASGYYSSIQDFTGGQTVRRWLSPQPLEAQRQFGLDVLRRFGGAP